MNADLFGNLPVPASGRDGSNPRVGPRRLAESKLALRSFLKLIPAPWRGALMIAGFAFTLPLIITVLVYNVVAPGQRVLHSGIDAPRGSSL